MGFEVGINEKLDFTLRCSAEFLSKTCWDTRYEEKNDSSSSSFEIPFLFESIERRSEMKAAYEKLR